MNAPKWAVITPMANEESDFEPFIIELKKSLDVIGNGNVYFIVDNVSKDRTLELCKELSKNDKRFVTVWAPENKNVVDAYIRGYKEALKSDAEFIHAYLEVDLLRVDQWVILPQIVDRYRSQELYFRIYYLAPVCMI